MSAILRVGLALFLCLGARAAAQAQVTIRVGEIASQRDCQFYETYWGGWLIVECRNNFAALRTRLQSALVETGRFVLLDGGRARYLVSGTITELGVTSSSAGGADYRLASARAVASFDIRLREAASGRIVYAGTITRSVEASASLSAGGVTNGSQSSPREIYAALQRELALGAVQAFAFHVDPLRVTAVSGRQIRLNYGAPLLAVDAAIQITDASGFPVRYRVTATMPDGAIAETAGQAGSVSVGAPAAVVDGGDPASGLNRYARAELPSAEDTALVGGFDEVAQAGPPTAAPMPPPVAPPAAAPRPARPRERSRPPARPRTAHVRLALVIANADYNMDGRTDTPPGFSQVQGFVGDLRNPANDGPAMRAALTRMGFEVIYVQDANRERMITELAQFGGRVAAAPGNAVVLVYYSGHALQVNGANFLIPTGARITLGDEFTRLPGAQAETIIGAHTVSANEILAQLRSPDSGGLNLIVLDACRDNPWEIRLNGRNRSLASRSLLFRSLAEQAPSLRNTLIAYSTAPGAVAADGAELAGANSPYTGALLQWIERPRLRVRDMLNSVGLAVEEATGQQPYVNNPPIEDICLTGC